MTDDPPADRPRLNLYAVAGIAVSGLVAVAALFLLPVLRARGVPFFAAFWLLAGIEFLAAVGIAVSVLRLHETGPIE